MLKFHILLPPFIPFIYPEIPTLHFSLDITHPDQTACWSLSLLLGPMECGSDYWGPCPRNTAAAPYVAIIPCPQETSPVHSTFSLPPDYLLPDLHAGHKVRYYWLLWPYQRPGCYIMHCVIPGPRFLNVTPATG